MHTARIAEALLAVAHDAPPRYHPKMRRGDVEEVERYRRRLAERRRVPSEVARDSPLDTGGRLAWQVGMLFLQGFAQSFWPVRW